MIKIVVVNDGEKKTMKERLQGLIFKVRCKLEDLAWRFKDFVCDNWQTILMYAPAVIAAIAGIVKLVKPSAAEMHERRMNKTYYDPRTGMHWDLKRDATNKDREEIMKRSRAGEHIEDILRDMKIMK